MPLPLPPTTAIDLDDDRTDEQTDTCQELVDGAVCGRDLPCQYHD